MSSNSSDGIKPKFIAGIILLLLLLLVFCCSQQVSDSHELAHYDTISNGIIHFSKIK